MRHGVDRKGRAMLKRRHSERGFTLIETLAAITVFAIMTLGVAPLLAASLRGSTLSRSFTKGKNVAQQAMERVRGLPYFVSGPNRVDVLDIYIPDKAAPGYSAGVYTTTCLETSSSTACPAGSVPADHTVIYETSFVRKDDAAAGPAEEYQVVQPDDGYSWSTATKPPEPLVSMTITVQWPVNGEVEEYQLQSLIGDRRFGGLKLDGQGVVDYAIQILTGFRRDDGQASDLSVLAGASQSRVESKLLTTADQDQSAAQLLLTDRSSPVDAGVELEGANVAVAAPPDAGPLAFTDTSPELLTHSDFGGAVVAGVDTSSYTGVEASVTSDLPISKGSEQVNAGTALGLLWVDNQASTGTGSPLRLRDADTVAWVRSDPTLPGIDAATEATTSALANQQLLVRAEAEVGSFLLLPTQFITDTTAAGAVVEIRGFESEVNCLAKPSTGTASASWKATLRYWEDPSDEDGLDSDGGGSGEDEDDLDVDAGSYQEVLLGGAAGSAELEAIQADPPMVYEDPLSTDPLGSPNDIYLFEPPEGTHDHATHLDDDNDPSTPAVNDDAVPADQDEPVPHAHPAYLSDWSALASVEVESAEPQLTSASIGGAIGITTRQTNPQLLESVINVSMGSLSCRALEAR